MNKAGKKIAACMGLLFAGYWFYTLMSVACLDRGVTYAKRMYDYSNFVPILLVLGFFGIAIYGRRIFFTEKMEQIEEKKFYLLLIVVSIVVFGIQLFLMQYLSKPIRHDFESIRKTAITLVEEHRFINQKYFNNYRMNRNILFVFAMIFSLFKSWSAVVVIGILMVNLSVLFTAQICYKLTESKRITLGIYLIGIILFDFAYRTFVPYTDNYGVFFLTAFLFLMFNRKNKNIWNLIGGGIFLAVGCYIKITIAILVIAGGIVLLCLKIKNKKRLAKQLLILGVLFLCTFGGLVKIQNRYFQENGFKDNPEIQRSVWHYFMLGQNDTSLGVVNKYDIRFSNTFDTTAQRNKGDKEEGLRRIKSRGIMGNLFFYTYKNLQNYNDGCFSPAQSVINGVEDYGDTFIEKIFIKEKEYNRYYALVEQTLWILVLSLIMIAALQRKQNSKEMLFLKLVIMGVSAYVLIFESRAKYLFMFVPVYLILAGLGLKELNLKRQGDQR